MCLAVPGRVVRWIDRTPPFETASIEFGGLQREINMACVPEAKIDDYVLVHAGIAISIVSHVEAQQMLRTLEQLNSAEEVFDDGKECPP